MELDRDAVERVLRRANEMSAAHGAVPGDPGGPGGHGRMSESVLLEAASEAGIEPDAVRLSLAIERLGPTAATSRLDRTVGPRDVAVERVIALDVDTLLGRVDDLLQRQHGLRRSRSAAEWGEWRRRTDAMAKVQRGIAKVGSSSGQLRKVARIEARTSVVDEQRTIVRLLADRRSQRTEAVAGGSAIGGAGLVVGGATAFVAVPIAAVVAPVGIVVGVAVARTGRRQHHELVTDLEHLLDAVERGVRPVTLTDDVRRVLRQLRG